ncbi:MAG: hypothetical protein ACTSUB_05375 [Candidatus Thorarchaeota archaeon]
MVILWRSYLGRILGVILALLILAYGTISMAQDYFAGYPFWWHNSALMFFGLALLGLFFLVKEGHQAFDNYGTYGLHPEKMDDSAQISSEFEQPEEITEERTYDT